MTDTPEDWILIEAAKRCGWEHVGYDITNLQSIYVSDLPYIALCDMIAKHEQKPVDRKLLCAREALDVMGRTQFEWAEQAAIRAIELWEEGFGK